MRHNFRKNLRLAFLGILLLTVLVSISFTARAKSASLIYLPIILSVNDSFPNGDFESGETGWVINPADETLILSRAELPEGISPHSGSYAAWLGNHHTSDSPQENSISQEISIPPHATDLSFWLWNQSTNNCSLTNSRVSIYVADQLQWWWPLCRSYNIYAWRNEIIDLESFANQKAKITIQVSLDSYDTSRVFLDDFLFTSH